MQLSTNTLLQGGKYRIERVLGQGGFGITYLATTKFTTQGELGTMEVEGHVAIKEFFMSEINSRKSDDSRVEGSSGNVFSNYRRKFKTEAQNLAKLNHPNIVKVYDVFDENNTTYYVMEFIDGQDLDHYIRQCGHIPEKEAVGIISEIGKALGYMHSRKMLHLDMKPKNVMRRRDGRCCLIDFGLSKQYTDDGEPESSTTIGLGTPGYAPLEQSQYKQDGTFPATLDVYALGATLYKMLSGERPPMASDILNQGFPMDKLKSLQVSDVTALAVKKAMNPMRMERFDSVTVLMKALPTCQTDDERTEFIDTPDDDLRRMKNPGRPKYAWKERNWFTNLALGGVCLYYACLIIVAGEDWGYLLNFDRSEDFFNLYMQVAILITLYFSFLLLQGQKCKWYIPMVVNLHPVAFMFLTVPYGVALSTLFIRHKGKSGWKQLDRERLGKPLFWNKERHASVNIAVITVICITLFTLLGVGSGLSYGDSYEGMIFSNILILLLGLLFLLKNAIGWAALTYPGILCLLVVGMAGRYGDFYLLILLIIPYLCLFGLLFIRKNGKSAWNLMQ